MQWLIDCFTVVWHCVGGGGSNPGGPQPAPEIDATSGVTALALLLCVAAIIYRQLQLQHYQQ
ncbi:MAG: hypothetical protein ABWX70_02390 [Hyphomicrobium sp.]